MSSRTMLRKAAAFLAVISFLLCATASFAQSREQLKAQVLKPPPGANVAIVEFYDLECPMCGHENPVLMAATAQYHVPWIRRDFPLKFHVWSFNAAVNARWFDTKGHNLGNEYRNEVFAHQSEIATKEDLHRFTEKFAAQHGIALPFMIDPQGKLADEVKADYALGVRLGVHQTPTAWVVTNGKNGAPRWTPVTNFNDLYNMLDKAIAQTSGK